MTRAAADEIPQIFGPISGLYQLFIPYKDVYKRQTNDNEEISISPGQPMLCLIGRIR